MSRVTRADDAVFRAISDPTRRRILDALAESEQAVGELVALFDVSQPAVSQHLRVLADAGLVQARRDGRRRLYRLRGRRLRAVHDWSAHYARFWDERLHALGRHLDARAERES